MDLSRRDFLKSLGALGAATALPTIWRPGLSLAGGLTTADLTTLGRTIGKGALLKEGSVGAYYALAEKPGEPHLLREELGAKRRAGGPTEIGESRRSIINFGHFTDIHLVDTQSPARVEFLDRYNDPGQGCEGMPFASAYRPQETLTLHILESMTRQLRAIGRSPLSGKRLQSVICTGDNIDNEQLNELRWFVDLMDGGGTINPNSGEGAYEGVMAADWGDVSYWHPDAGVADKYKQQYGFPDYPEVLEGGIKPFKATGVGLPWYQTFGNHDGLMQGNAPHNAVFDRIAVGGTKLSGLAPGINPCDAFTTLKDNPSAFLAAPAHPVAADPTRKIVSRLEYIQEMFKTTGKPAGHGFSESSKTSGVAYWHTDDHPGFRFIGLDTVPPGGYADGSLGATQFAWLEEKLLEVSAAYFDVDGNEAHNDVANKYVIIFSHHGLRSLDNPNAAPTPFDPASNDFPRVMADEIEALLHRFPNVIAWVNGHSHLNVIVPRPSPLRTNGGFWDIGTAAHIDWSCQSRLVEVVDNGDGTLSIFCTMFDHAAPITPSGSDPVLRLASISRELAANDYQAGFDTGSGEPKDRNVELVINTPFTTRTGSSRKRSLKAPASL
jgi:metallophosphoesterase (TIGR03767 family)